MTESLDSQRDDDNPDTLRKTLEAMRQEAAREVMRLKRQLAERGETSDSAVASVTERLALQQEMTVLQQMLEGKAQALDHITEECRRLEDQLEDNNMALDGLKQETERKDQALQGAQVELLRLRQEMERERRLAAASAAAASAPAAPLPPTKRPLNALLVGLLALFMVLSGLLALLLYPLREQITVPFAAVNTPAVSRPSQPPTPEITTQPPPAEVAPTAPAPTPRSDRLRSGGQAPALMELAGGAFQMGSNSLSGEDFSPAHSVQIAPFLIGVHEVTFRDYDRFARATGRSLPKDFGWGRDTRPVVGVSWDDATAYVGWLSQETGKRYRLPSEAEWEFAARGGGTGSYWWGFGIEPGRAVCLDCGSRWDNRSTAPVGSFPPNPFGLYDQAGNAMEWVADCYQAGYRNAPDDGRARQDKQCATRVARSGAFNKPAVSMRVYVRAHFTPQSQFNLLGFRVARDP